MTWEDLKAFIGATNPDGLTDEYVQSCFATAQTLVDGLVGTATVPTAVLDRAYLMCGAELFNQRAVKLGIGQWNAFEGAPIRVGRDPLNPVYPLLAGYVVMGL